MQFELCIATGFTMVAPEGFEPPTFWFVASTEDFYPVYGLHILQNEQLKTYNFGKMFTELTG